MAKSNVNAFVVWDESMPLIQLVDFLTINHYAAVISPLHDKDTYTAEDCKRWRESQELLHGVYIDEDAKTWERPTGELRTNELGAPVKVTKTEPVPQVGDLKKPHRHVIIMLDYSAPLQTWLNNFAPLDIHYMEIVKSKRGYLRYLCHLDNPEKARYNVHDVIMLGGVDISCLYDKTQRDADNLEIRILNAIVDHKLDNVCKLQNCLLHDMHDKDAYREVKAHYGYWSQYMRNMYYVTTVQMSKSAKYKRLSIDADGVIQEEKEVTEDAKKDDSAA